MSTMPSESMSAHSTAPASDAGIGNPAYSAAARERFWTKVDASGDCWLWTAGRTSTGYGSYPVWVDGRVQANYAHRFAYRCLVDDVPPGLELDHLCRNRLCVNPDHLEPVTRRENLRRSGATPLGATHCRKGHRFDEANTYWWVRNGKLQRRCRACADPINAAAVRRYRAKRAREAPPQTA
jgi:hypothetical protein